MMWDAISKMVIKAADNMNRGVENASQAGEGNNGVDYSNVDTGSSEGSSGGAVGGGYQKPAEQNTSGVATASNEMKNISSMGKDALSNVGGNNNPSDAGKETEGEDVKDVSATTSDERLKNIFGDNEDIIKVFSKIDAIQFTYKDKAHNIPDAENRGVDNDLHYGIKAQDLENSPLTKSAVVEDEQGNKLVDTKELTTINSAVISEICKRLEIIEKVLGIKVV